MRAPRSVPQLLIALLCFAVSEAQSQTDTTKVAPYALSDESRYETGCFGPCAHPRRRRS
jgi:hypothetical protein